MIGIFVVFHLLLSKTIGFMTVHDTFLSLKKALENIFLLLERYPKISPPKMVHFPKHFFRKTINTIYICHFAPDVYLNHYGKRCMVYLIGQNFGGKRQRRLQKFCPAKNYVQQTLPNKFMNGKSFSSFLSKLIHFETN